jgi:glycosyltransferase involved in cell wall biosynthesis
MPGRAKTGGLELANAKVAILHPLFVLKGGAEKVVDILAEMYPEADIYGLFVDPAKLFPIVQSRGVRPSILNAFPFSSKLYRQLMPFYPWAVESIDLREYDLVISSCGQAMMGCSIREDATHICYCHSPERTWWDLYTQTQHRLPVLVRHPFVMSAAKVRTWEFCAMQRVDHVIANSSYIADRIFKYFRRDSTVIYPPVGMTHDPARPPGGDYYLSVGRLAKLKRLDILIRACNELGSKLVIVGTGREEKYLKSIAGPNIDFRGYIPDEALPGVYANCRAFLFAANEDFGIAPVEAQAYGRPVIAYGHGGSLETVRVNDPEGLPDTGIFFPSQTVESVIDALRRFEAIEDRFVPEAIQAHARRFDTDAFVHSFGKFVDDVMNDRTLVRM